MSLEGTCTSCSHDLTVDGSFCSGCGTQVREVDRTLVAVRHKGGTARGADQCPSCNSVVSPDELHCRFCGAKVRDTIEVQPDDPTPEAGTAAETAMIDRLNAETGAEFDVVSEIGRGGMGSVYLARERALQRDVAIKVLAPEFVSDERLLARFRSEARIVATLRHRSIVAIHSVRHTPDLHYFIMDYVEGASLNDVIKRHGPLDVSVVKSVLYEVGNALAFAHRQGNGIVHRDIKPSNIMLDREGAVIVMDFGISKTLGTNQGLTMDGSIIGTPEYMSPEQCRGNDLTVASDQYSLGLLGYAMLAGSPPFTGMQWTVVSCQMTEEPPHIQELRPDCPDDLADSIHRMLKKGKADRWPSITDGLKAFDGRHRDVGDAIRDEMARLVRETSGFAAPDAEVSKVVVTAPRDVIRPGDDFAPSVEMFDGDGLMLRGRHVAWSTSDPNILMISPEDGRVVAKAAGRATLTAVVDGVDQSLEITVTEPNVGSVEVSPASVQVRPGQRIQLTVVVRDVSGSPMNVKPTWSVSDTKVAKIDSEGTLVAGEAGEASVTVEAFGRETTVRVEVGRFTIPIEGKEPVGAAAESLKRRPSTGQTAPGADGRRRRLAAVWFADIRGYTALFSEDEDAALKIVDIFQQAAGEAVGPHNGRVVKFIGDAVMTVFDSADRAVRSALEFEKLFAASEVVKRHKVAVRVGVHLGDIVEADDGDVYGDGVNTASRVEGIAEPGQVAVTEAVYQQIRNRKDLFTEMIGLHELKGLPEPVPIYAVTLEPPVARSQPAGAGASGSPRKIYRRAAAIGLTAAIVGFGTLMVSVASQSASDVEGSENGEVVAGTEGAAGEVPSSTDGSQDPATASAAAADSPPAGASSNEEQSPAGGESVTQRTPTQLAQPVEAAPVNTASPAPPSRMGAWTVEDSADPFSDATTVRAVLSGSGGAQLILNCLGRDTEARIAWPQELTGEDVTTRLDDGRARTDRWDLSADSKATTYRGDPRRLIRDWASGETLAVRAEGVSGSMTTVFRLAGIEEASESLRDACGF